MIHQACGFTARQNALGVTVVTTDKRKFDEDPEQASKAKSEDEMAEELAMQEAGSEAAIPEPQPKEPENPESFADDIPFETGPSERHFNPDPSASGSVFGSFGTIQTTFPSGRTQQFRSGQEEADWFNQFRERLSQSHAETQAGNVQIFGTTEAAEVPVHKVISEDEGTAEGAEQQSDSDDRDSDAETTLE